MITNLGVSTGYQVTLRYGFSPSQLLIEDTQPTSANRALFLLNATFPQKVYGQAWHGTQKLSGILPLTPTSLLPNLFPDPTMNNPSLWTLPPEWSIALNRLVLNAPTPKSNVASVQYTMTPPCFMIQRTTGTKMTSTFNAKHVIGNNVSPGVSMDGVSHYGIYTNVIGGYTHGIKGDGVTICAGYLSLIELFNNT
jgi:hypothetical protein